MFAAFFHYAMLPCIVICFGTIHPKFMIIIVFSSFSYDFLFFPEVDTYKMRTHFIIPSMPNNILKSLVVLLSKLCCGFELLRNLSIHFFTWHFAFWFHVSAYLI